jgi:hypothetical protein
MEVYVHQELLHLIDLVEDHFSKVINEARNLWLKETTPICTLLMVTTNHQEEVSCLMPLDYEKLLQQRPERNGALPSYYACHRAAGMSPS